MSSKSGSEYQSARFWVVCEQHHKWEILFFLQAFSGISSLSILILNPSYIWTIPEGTNSSDVIWTSVEQLWHHYECQSIFMNKS